MLNLKLEIIIVVKSIEINALKVLVKEINLVSIVN